MNITHICLAGMVTDGWSYQDNLLPKYHARLGHSVSFIASKFVWGNDGKPAVCDRDEYINADTVHFYRLDTEKNAPFESKFKRFGNLYQTIEKTMPDIIFLHGCQILDVDVIVKYIKKHKNITVYVDNHADFSNSAIGWASKNLLHKILWKNRAKMINPYVKKWYGVLPARVDFLHDIYGLPKEKIELLVMGADDEKVREAHLPGASEEIRRKYGIGNDDFLIMTGGKIDTAKQQTILLMEAVNRLNNPNVKLIAFGSVTETLSEKVKANCSDNVKYIGWVKSDDSYRYFAASDLVVFPGRHSVFWEQVAGLGVPMLCKYWEGTTHIDCGGNVRFLYEDSADEIYRNLKEITENKAIFDNMKKAACENASDMFSYANIAKKSLGD